MTVARYAMMGAASGGLVSDPDFASVVLLLHCNGADESTAFIDTSNSAHTITANGNAQVDTSEKKFGSGSLLLDGSNDSLSALDNIDWSFLAVDCREFCKSCR